MWLPKRIHEVVIEHMHCIQCGYLCKLNITDICELNICTAMPKASKICFEGRTRRSFNELEKQFLMNLVQKEKSILDLKENTNKVTSRKNQAWDRIVKKFNEQPSIKKGETECSATQLKKVLENLKAKAKKDVAQEKKTRHQTGGGPVEKDTVADDLSHMVASYCSEVLKPLDNSFDNDTDYHNVPETIKKHTAAGKPPTNESDAENPSARSEDEVSKPTTSMISTLSTPATSSKQQTKVAPKALPTALL
ncbi:fibrinogen silencer-binding protein-like [Lineus longissimus]|uniref:fibrinogen silencer-binding protein-like n=1 Tax=Lineus longissimus TaxID=88925 RepID=UPI00315D2003